MRLGGICRLGFALWILNEFCAQADIPLKSINKNNDKNARFDSFPSGEVRIPLKWATDSGDVGRDSVLMWAAFSVSP